MALNKTQIQYACDKIDRTAQQRLKIFMTTIGDEPTKDWSKKQKLDLIRTNKAKLKAKDADDYYHYLFDSFSYPKFDDTLYKSYEKKLSAFVEKQEREVNALKDKLVFLGNEDALSAIEKFCN